MKKKIAPLVENIAEATTACLVTMVQGNLLLLGLSHWVIASQTGIAAGVLSSIALLLAGNSKRWVIAVVLGVITAVVDYFVHPGMIGEGATEAIITGIGAAVLSLLAGFALDHFRKWRKNR